MGSKLGFVIAFLAFAAAAFLEPHADCGAEKDNEGGNPNAEYPAVNARNH